MRDGESRHGGGTGDAGAELARWLGELRRRDARRRAASELTFRQLATRTGWAHGVIAQYFSGRTLPPTDRLDALALLLGASPAELGRLGTIRDRADDLRRARRRSAAAAVTRVQFRLLGPVEVIGPNGKVELTEVQRTLIAVLALRPGVVISPHSLVDALWGLAAPRTAVKTMYGHISRIRGAICASGAVDVLRTHDRGYALELRANEATDVARFEADIAAARQALAAGATSNAIAFLQNGLALWRGEAALSNATPANWARAEVDRLYQMRLSAIEDLWEARLSLGVDAAAVDEMAKLLLLHPTRERLADLHLLALHQSGRRTAAMQAFQRLRLRLAEQLNQTPSRKKRRLLRIALAGNTTDASSVLGLGQNKSTVYGD